MFGIGGDPRVWMVLSPVWKGNQGKLRVHVIRKCGPCRGQRFLPILNDEFVNQEHVGKNMRDSDIKGREIHYNK